MKKIHRKKPNLNYLLTIGFVVIVFAVSFQLMKVRRIDCFSQYGPCPDEMVTHLNHLLNTPLLKPLPTAEVKADLITFSQIKSISLYRRLPSSLVVALSLRRPIGALGPNVLGAQAIADDEGIIFQKISQSALPTLITTELPPIASRLSKDQLNSLTSLNLVSELFDTQVSGVLSEQTLTITAPNDLKIVLNVAQPTSNWYTPLQLIIRRSKINAKMPHKIDLRFTNSVITY